MKTVAAEFIKFVPSGFLGDLVAMIKQAYPACLQDTRRIDRHIRPNVAGVQRWGTIESRLKDLCDHHGLEAEWVPNSTQSSYHVELRVGRFVCTVSKTEAPSKLPVDADFRRTLLEATQLRLFEASERRDGYVYALITHGPDSDSEQPSFVQVLFPDPDGWITDKIDLLALSGVAGASDLGMEVVEDEAKPALRRVRLAEGDSRRQDLSDA